MQEKLLTPGEFAKLARTTKRTVLWYAEKGILMPHTTDTSGYRLYRPKQIIDFQGVLLMRKLGFSIADIKAQVTRGRSLRQLFEVKRDLIERQIAELQCMLMDTRRYYNNLTNTGTLVRPEVKQQSAFEIYYIDREGPYAKIKDYIEELRVMLTGLPPQATFLTIFMDGGYSPRKARMKIGVVWQADMRPKVGVEVSRMSIPAYSALSYEHNGPTELLSLLWQELEKYRESQRLDLDDTLPFADLEFYTLDTQAETGGDEHVITKLHLPVRE